jgi:hypothetical protein
VADDLVDQLGLVIRPDIALELIESPSTLSGITIQTYRATGRPQYATASPLT